MRDVDVLIQVFVEIEMWPNTASRVTRRMLLRRLTPSSARWIAPRCPRPSIGWRKATVNSKR